jgi:arylsulfatase A-like enzyme
MTTRSSLSSPFARARRAFLTRTLGIGALAIATLAGCRSGLTLSRPFPSPTPTQAPSTDPRQPAPARAIASPTSSNRPIASATPVPAATPAPSIAAAPLTANNAPNRATATRQPNVILITVDTLRADHIGAYGMRAAQTPTIDRLAREGARFDRAICQLPQTNPSHTALLTGLYASTNGVKIHMVDQLRSGVQTMADVFLQGGYRTGAIYSWVSLDPQFSGLNRGFQTYDGYVLNRSLLFSNPNLEQLAALYRQIEAKVPIVKTADAHLGSSDEIERRLDGRADVTNAAVFNWLDTHASAGPFFLWVHYYDPHYPYTPPAGFDHLFGLKYTGHVDGSIDTLKAIEDGKLTLTDADLARLGELYQGEIAYTDSQIGRLVANLGSRGMLDDTILVVTGDHGESFGEHGDWTHGLKVFESEVRVPLVIRYPARVPAGVAVSAPVQLIDVMPTLLELTGLRPAKPIQGTSLLPLVTHASAATPGLAFVELADEAFVALLTTDWKIIRNNANGELQLYHLTDDEAELHNLIRAEPRVAQDLAAQLQQLMVRSGVSR